MFERWKTLRFVDRAAVLHRAAALQALKTGNPVDEATSTHGPVSTEAALLQLLQQVETAFDHGARLLMGGSGIERPGSLMEITILSEIKPDNPAFRGEFFGPVVSFYRVKNEEEAMALANNSNFGLGGSVWTQDIARGKRVASRIDTGMMFIDNIDWTDAELPFGGIKDSGYGRKQGSLGIQEFVNKKRVRLVSLSAPPRPAQCTQKSAFQPVFRSNKALAQVFISCLAINNGARR